MKRIIKKKQNDFISDQSPAQVETNGPETKCGIVLKHIYLITRKEANVEPEPVWIERWIS